jgi:hypothetical protein
VPLPAVAGAIAALAADHATFASGSVLPIDDLLGPSARA